MGLAGKIRRAGVALFIAWVCSVTLPSQADENCDIAQDYDDLASRSEKEYADETALDYRARAVDLCPTFNRWQAYGELAMRFGDATLIAGCLNGENEGGNEGEAGCQTGTTAAAEAFIAALPLASDNATAARAIGRYAEVLYLENDPQKANNYISEALRLDPENSWIRELADEIPKAMNTREAMRSGLGDFKVPEMVLASLSSPAPFTDNARISPETTPLRTNAINVPLNFLVSSTRLDDTSRDRLKDVVEILAEDIERSYHIVGHADVTGNSMSNQTLSEERADAIYSMIVTMEPALSERITYEGVGSTRPMRLEMTSDAHRANRRVEIYVR
ncbi:MAG: OmpA family protein [Pseudomonadota bacterium]